MQGHHSAKPHTSCQVPRCHVHACCSHSCELVDAQADADAQPTDPGYSFGTSFHYRLIRESLIFATFRPQEWGSAYTWDGLYAVYTVCVSLTFTFMHQLKIPCFTDVLDIIIILLRDYYLYYYYYYLYVK